MLRSALRCTKQKEPVHTVTADSRDQTNEKDMYTCMYMCMDQGERGGESSCFKVYQRSAKIFVAVYSLTKTHYFSCIIACHQCHVIVFTTGGYTTSITVNQTQTTSEATKKKSYLSNHCPPVEGRRVSTLHDVPGLIFVQILFGVGHVLENRSVKPGETVLYHVPLRIASPTPNARERQTKQRGEMDARPKKKRARGREGAKCGRGFLCAFRSAGLAHVPNLRVRVSGVRVRVGGRRRQHACARIERFACMGVVVAVDRALPKGGDARTRGGGGGGEACATSILKSSRRIP